MTVQIVKERRRLCVFENRVPMRMFGPKREEATGLSKIT